MMEPEKLRLSPYSKTRFSKEGKYMRGGRIDKRMSRGLWKLYILEGRVEIKASALNREVFHAGRGIVG